MFGKILAEKMTVKELENFLACYRKYFTIKLAFQECKPIADPVKKYLQMFAEEQYFALTNHEIAENVKLILVDENWTFENPGLEDIVNGSIEDLIYEIIDEEVIDKLGDDETEEDPTYSLAVFFVPMEVEVEAEDDDENSDEEDDDDEDGEDEDDDANPFK